MVRATGTLARDDRLSAYLDGELPGEEAETLESELALDPDMRSALEGLRQVADGLNALGEVRAPRSFTIVAMQVPRTSRLPRLEFATRLGAAVAAVALMVVVAGDRLVDGARDAAPLAATVSSVAQSEMAAAPVAEAVAGAGTAEEATSTAVAELAAPSPSPAPQDATTEDALAAPAPPTTGTPSASMPARAGDAAEGAPAAPTPAPAGTPVAEAADKAAGDDGGEAAEATATPAVTAATTPPAAGVEETAVAAAPEAVAPAASAAEADGGALGAVELVEIALLAAAVLLAGATIVQLFARRR